MPLTHSEILAMMEPVGQIAIEGDRIVVTLDTADPRPAVYAWVIGPEIIYLGKAGFGMKRRMGQHRNGFRGGSVRGKGHAAYMIERDEPVAIFAMWPDPLEYHGHKIPGHSAIEDWLLDVCDPKPVRNMAGVK